MTPLANEMVAQGWEQGTLHLAARATVGEYEFDIKAGEKLAGTLNAGASLTYQTDVSDQLPGPQETAALLAGFAANKPAPAPTLPVAPVQQLTEHASPNTSEPVLEPPTEVAPKEPSRPTPRRKRGQGTRHNNPNQVSRRQGNPNQVSRRKAKPSRQLGNPNQVSGGNRRR
jgi:hypothetical protein